MKKISQSTSLTAHHPRLTNTPKNQILSRVVPPKRRKHGSDIEARRRKKSEGGGRKKKNFMWGKWMNVSTSLLPMRSSS
jgi:hypothetical protein